MTFYRPEKPKNPQEPRTKHGFTLIEVMLVLAVASLMLIGVIGGTYSSISTQRYNDSVRSFAEFLRTLYSEVASPETLGAGDSDLDAIYGKVAIFGYKDANDNDIVYSATLVGQTTPPTNESSMLDELVAVQARIYCGLITTSAPSEFRTYTPTWEAKIDTPDTADKNKPLQGTLLIFRSPSTGVIHTAFSSEFPSSFTSVATLCPTPANPDLPSKLPVIENRATPNGFTLDDDIDFCIVSDNSRIVRDIRLTADGHNSSAVNLIPTDGDTRCAQN